MKRVVLDASVISKWFIEEEDSDKALEIRDLYVQGRIGLSSPLLVLYELGNVLLKHPSLTMEVAGRAFDAFLGLQIDLKSFAEVGLLKDCMEISKKFNVTFYDASYVSLSKLYNAGFVTADKQLYEKIKGKFEAFLLKKLSVEELIEEM